MRDKFGFKNILIANPNRPSKQDLISLAVEVSLVDPNEAATYLLEHYAWDIHIAIHELLWNGTDNRHLNEQEDVTYNFDILNPPANPLTAAPVQTWYKKHEDINGIFGDLVRTLNEYCADCVELYLIMNKKILSIFGYDHDADDRK